MGKLESILGPSDLKPPHPGEFTHQCIRCAWIAQPNKELLNNFKCPECQGTMFRRVDLTWGPDLADFDRPDPEAIAHMKREVKECLNFAVNPQTKQEYRHPLKLRKEYLRIIRANQRYVQVRDVCETCGLQYHQQWIPEQRLDLIRKLSVDLEKIPREGEGTALQD